MNKKADDGWKAEIVQAGVDGVAKGLRRSLPVLVALMLIGPWVCGYMAFAHFVLGVEIQATLISGGLLGIVGVGASIAARYFKGGGGPDQPGE